MDENWTCPSIVGLNGVRKSIVSWKKNEGHRRTSSSCWLDPGNPLSTSQWEKDIHGWNGHHIWEMLGRFQYLCSPLLMGLPFLKIKKHMWESLWLQLKCYDMGTLNLGNIEEHRGTLKKYFEWHTARLRNASTFWGSNSPHLEVIGGACGHSLAQIIIAVGDSMVYGIPM